MASLPLLWILKHRTHSVKVSVSLKQTGSHKVGGHYYYCHSEELHKLLVYPTPDLFDFCLFARNHGGGLHGLLLSEKRKTKSFIVRPRISNSSSSDLESFRCWNGRPKTSNYSFSELKLFVIRPRNVRRQTEFFRPWIGHCKIELLELFIVG